MALPPTYTLNPMQEIMATRLSSDERGEMITQNKNTCNCLAHNWTCRWNVTYLTKGTIILEHEVLDDLPPPNPIVPRSAAQPLTQAQWDGLTFKRVDSRTVVLWKLFEPPMFRGETITLKRTLRWLSREPWVEIPTDAPPGETIREDHVLVRCRGCNGCMQIDSPAQWMRHRDGCTGIEKRMVFFVMERWEKSLLQ